MDMLRRAAAVEKTLAAYDGRRFDPANQITCAHLARDHMVNMGHSPPEMPDFDSMFGAAKLMRERGWDDVAAMLDSMLPRRRAPAFMLLGDIVLAPGDGLDAMLICAGPFKLIGWVQEHDKFVRIDRDMNSIIAVWEL